MFVWDTSRGNFCTNQELIVTCWVIHFTNKKQITLGEFSTCCLYVMVNSQEAKKIWVDHRWKELYLENLWRNDPMQWENYEESTKIMFFYLYIYIYHDSKSLEKNTANQNINSNFGPGTTQNLPQEELLSRDMRMGSPFWRNCWTMRFPILQGNHR